VEKMDSKDKNSELVKALEEFTRKMEKEIEDKELGDNKLTTSSEQRDG
jgi:hypothetical protein